MRKAIYIFALISLFSLSFMPAIAATTASVSTGLTQVQAGGSAPIVKAKWEANVDGYTDDSVAAGAQFNPTASSTLDRVIKICAIVTDPDGVADVKGVYADVYYPTGIAVGTSHVKLPSQDGSPTAGCGVLMQEDTLVKLDKAAGIDLFCNHVRNQNNLLPTFNTAPITYTYDEICKADGELMKETAYVACADKHISYEDPAGMYKVTAVAQDANSLNGTLVNSFEYLPITAFETDFTSVSYGNVKINTHKIINGDLTWGGSLATVRNVGNTRLTLKVLQDDMGLGKTSGNWNVQYDARVGSDATFAVYDPNVLTTLANSLDLSEKNEVDFSILVTKFPNSGSTSWTGNITLSADPAAPLCCGTDPVGGCTQN
jgi:hypothetical protein